MIENQVAMTAVPLGEPDLGPGGSPNRSFDRAPHVRRAFSYQDYAAYALLLRSIDGFPHRELWVEHHEDILAIRSDGRYDLFQVKTSDSSPEPWMIGDKPIHDAIARFCAHEAIHRDEIVSYFLYSNVRPYVPANTATVERRARSFSILQHELSQNGVNQLTPEIAASLAIVQKAVSVSQDTLLEVIRKLRFMVGPSIDTISDNWPSALCVARPALKRWPIHEVVDLQNMLIHRIRSAGSAGAPPLLLHTSPVSAGGLSTAEVMWRRIDVGAMRRKVSRRMSRRKWSRVLLSVGKIAIWMVVGGIALRPILQVSPLQQAVNVIQHSRNGVLPADFNESVAIVRAAHKPLEHLDLEGANVQCLDLSGLNMLQASGQFMHATGTNFDNSILGGAIFGNSELNGAKFRHTHMDAISFEHSNMLVADLVGAEARNAHFDGASLTGANLSHGAFSGTDFSGADLQSTEMVDTDMSKTDLKGSVLTDANVSGVDFTGAKHLTQAMLSSACIVGTKAPVVDAPLKPPSKACYNTPQEREERQTKRLLTLAMGQLAVSQGYCKNFQHQFRPSDSKLYPNENEGMWFGPEEIGDGTSH